MHAPGCLDDLASSIWISPVMCVTYLIAYHSFFHLFHCPGGWYGVVLVLVTPRTAFSYLMILLSNSPPWSEWIFQGIPNRITKSSNNFFAAVLVLLFFVGYACVKRVKWSITTKIYWWPPLPLSSFTESIPIISIGVVVSFTWGTNTLSLWNKSLLRHLDLLPIFSLASHPSWFLSFFC